MFHKTLLFIIGVAITAASRCDHFYRKDYTYVEQFDAFYKLHWDLAGQSWSSAFLACDDEGSTLFYPKIAEEWTVVKGLVTPMKNKPNVTEIFVGIHDEFGLGEFMTVDGLSTPSPLPDKDSELDGQSACVTMEIDSGVYKLESCETDSVKPFVCKKVEEVEPSCPTIDRDYTYDKEAKKCYKLNQRKKSWTDAMQTCFMEGGVLAVITNSVEAGVVFQKLLENEEEYFVGFRRLFPNGDFYTVKGVAITAASRCDHFYRKDYTYVEQFDAFYKLHWDLAGQSWSSAFLACDDEGSTLFYPKIAEEWTVVKGLVTPMKNKPNVTEIFVGIHDEFGLGEFMTVDGLSTPSPLPDKDSELDGQSACVTMEIDSGVYKLESCETDSVKPFVCKKVEEVEPSCPTIDRDYTYDKEAKKCYKLNQRKKSWTDAMQTCFMEGGVLAVITNSVEAGVVFQKLLENEEEYFVGFRRLFPNGDFYTVKGQQFDNTFYKRWRHENNEETDTASDCGSVLKLSDYRDRDLYTSTRNCFRPAPFLCEMKAKV